MSSSTKYDEFVHAKVFESPKKYKNVAQTHSNLFQELTYDQRICTQNDFENKLQFQHMQHVCHTDELGNIRKSHSLKHRKCQYEYDDAEFFHHNLDRSGSCVQHRKKYLCSMQQNHQLCPQQHSDFTKNSSNIKNNSILQKCHLHQPNLRDLCVSPGNVSLTVNSYHNHHHSPLKGHVSMGQGYPNNFANINNHQKYMETGNYLDPRHLPLVRSGSAPHHVDQSAMSRHKHSLSDHTIKQQDFQFDTPNYYIQNDHRNERVPDSYSADVRGNLGNLYNGDNFLDVNFLSIPRTHPNSPRSSCSSQSHISPYLYYKDSMSMHSNTDNIFVPRDQTLQSPIKGQLSWHPTFTTDQNLSTNSIMHHFKRSNSDTFTGKYPIEDTIKRSHSDYNNKVSERGNRIERTISNRVHFSKSKYLHDSPTRLDAIETNRTKEVAVKGILFEEKRGGSVRMYRENLPQTLLAPKFSLPFERTFANP